MTEGAAGSAGSLRGVTAVESMPPLAAFRPSYGRLPRGTGWGMEESPLTTTASLAGIVALQTRLSPSKSETGVQKNLGGH